MEDFFELHIDESGLFEKSKDQKDNKARVIGGIAVPLSLMKKREGLSSDIMEIGKRYFIQMRSPTDIHISDTDKYLPGKNKNDLRKELISFMKNRMDGAKIFFIYDKTDLNKKDGPPEAQLYRNMLAHLLQAIRFYHPYFKDNVEFKCNLAHRRFPYEAKYEDALAGNGYLKMKDAWSGKTFFTAITKAELEGIMMFADRSLRFRSARKASYEVKPYLAWKDPFMAMADCICNTILFNIKWNNTKGIQKKLVGTFGKERILFYCPSDYILPENLLTNLYQNQSGEFLEKYLSLSKIREKRFVFCDAYLTQPAVKKTFKQLLHTRDPEECKTIIALADNFLDNRDFYKLGDVEALIYLIKEHMDTITDRNSDEVWDPIAYSYHNISLKYCNHTSNNALGLLHRNKGMQIYDRLNNKDFHQARAHHEFINRTSVWDSNEFAFERANSTLINIKEKEESFINILGQVRNEILGKIYGSIAQNYAFMQKYTYAQEYFKKAVSHLPPDDFMQASFRAHLAIDMNDKMNFEKEVCTLFKHETFPGYNTLIDQCLSDINENSFPLHLLLKGLLVFLEKEPKDLIAGLVPEIFTFQMEGQQHPWELIYIIMGRHLKALGHKSDARKFWELSMKFAKSEDQITFVMIGHSACAWAALSWLDENNIKKAKDTLHPIVKTFKSLHQNDVAPGIFNLNKISDEDGTVRSGWFDDVGKRFLYELSNADESTLRSICEEFIQRFTFNYW